MLFRSSMFITILHILAQLWYRQTNLILTLTIIGGLSTSIWNHGTTSRIAMISDRVMMVIDFCADAYLILIIPLQFKCVLATAMLISSVVLYWVSKMPYASQFHINSFWLCAPIRQIRGSNIPHMIAHLSLTMTHIILMSIFAT